MLRKKISAVLAALTIAICSVNIPASADMRVLQRGNRSYSDSSKSKVTGWKTVGGKKYYFDENGNAKTGWLKLGNDYYYFREDGSAVIGETVSIGGKSYSFGSDGKYIPAYADGWHKDDSGNYFYTESNKRLTGFRKISGSTYYFDDSGKMITGSVTVGGGDYYFGSDGRMHKGWKKLGSDYYYYMSDGRMAKNTSLNIDGKTCIFGSDGKYSAPARTSGSNSHADFILNTNTKKFHLPTCSEVSRIKDRNRYDYSGTRDEVIDMGYVPCKKCCP